MSTEIVGPVQTVTFWGGPAWDGTGSIEDHWASRPRIAYTPPRNTCDPRVRACTDHHVACDCREAEWAEERAEWRYEHQERDETIRRVLAGHNPLACRCTGCQIVVALGLSHRVGA